MPNYWTLIISGILNVHIVKIDKVPATVEEFIEMRDNIATTPARGAVMFILALKIYLTDPEIGSQ